MGAVTTLDVNSEGKLEPGEGTWLGDVVLLAYHAEVSADLGEGLSVAEVHTLDMVAELFRDHNLNLTCRVVVEVIKSGSIGT